MNPRCQRLRGVSEHRATAYREPELIHPSRARRGIGVSPHATSLVRRLDLRTRAVFVVAGSNDLWARKWSPDGRFLAAETLDSKTLKLYDFHTGNWTGLASGFRQQGNLRAGRSFPYWVAS